MHTLLQLLLTMAPRIFLSLSISLMRFFGVAALLLMGSSAVEARNDADVELSPDKNGLVIVSLTLSQMPESFFGPTLCISYAPTNSFRMGSLFGWRPTCVDTKKFLSRAPSDFKDVWGKVLAFEIDEGDYDLVRIEFTAADKVSQYWIPLMRFHATRGQAVYLGNIDVQMEFGKDLLGLPKVIAKQWQLLDSSQRDVEIFLSRYPKVAPDQVITGLISSKKST